MKTTPEKIAEWKSLVPKLNDDSDDHMDVAHSADMAPQHTVNFRHAKNAHEAAWAIHALIADLEETKEQLRSNAHRANADIASLEQKLFERSKELAATRKQLDSERLISKQLAEQVGHWKANHDNVVAKLRLFTQREDLPVDRLPAYEYVLELEKKLADANNRERLISKNLDFERELHAKTEAELAATRKQLAEAQALIHAGQPTLDSSSIESVVAFWSTQCWRRAALDAAITEAINGEKQNPWKMAIINELIVSHILHTDHETDPIKALAALVDYECKVALDPAVSKEAQELIEPYRKDAERFQELLSRLGDDSGLTIVKIKGWSDEYPGYAWFADLSQEQVIAELDAAIAAKGGNT